MRKRLSAWIPLGFKLAITTVVLYYLLRRISLGPALSQIAAIRPSMAIAAGGLVLTQLAVGSVRWWLISNLLAAPMTIAKALEYTMVGQFFNQVLPTALGGDAVRAWLASNHGAPLGNAIRAVLCDRLVGLMALLIIISATLFVKPEIADNSLPMQYVMRSTAILTCAALAGLYFFGDPLARRLQTYRWAQAIGRLIRDLRAALFSRETSVWTLSTSFAAHVAAVGAICLCANGMGVTLEFGRAMTVVPAIVLVSMAPISIAGWGVREGAMIFGLGMLGVVAGDALAVSLAYGLLQIVIGIPGGALWLAGSRDRSADRQ